MLFREIITVSFENRANPTNTLLVKCIVFIFLWIRWYLYWRLCFSPLQAKCVNIFVERFISYLTGKRIVPLQRSGDYLCAKKQFRVCIGRFKSVNIRMEINFATFVNIIVCYTNFVPNSLHCPGPIHLHPSRKLSPFLPASFSFQMFVQNLNP